MLRCAARRLVRRKHGQTAWSPNASSHGAAPPMGVTAQELQQLVYRPLPMADTVEYEEDFGRNMILHRECMPRAYRDQLSTAISGLAYSDTELHNARAQLAQTMNRERAGGHISPASASDTRDVVHFDVDIDDNTRHVRSARYLFDEARMQYCDRFQTFFRSRQQQQQQQQQQRSRDDATTTSSADEASSDTEFYFSLMEACAVVYGCATLQAREVYMKMFLGLDVETLEADEAALRECAADAARVQAQLATSTSSNDGDKRSSSSSSTTANAAAATTELQAVQAIIDAVPPLFDHGVDSDKDDKATATSPTSSTTTTTTTSDSSNSIVATLPEAFDEYGSLYSAYLAHARGDSPVASYDTSVLHAATALAQRRRWRHIIELLVQEQYTALSTDDLCEAAVLNAQLHTIKFADLKVGDTVREIVQVLQRETGDGSSVHRDTPYARSPSHPERRD